MSKKAINDLKKEIAIRERELQALVDAVNLIVSASSGPGRRIKITAKTIGALASDGGTGKTKKKTAKKGTGRRGRPPGSKNKKGAKKPGPKPQSGGRKRGRPAKKAAVVTPSAPAKKAVKAAAIKKTKPAKRKASKASKAKSNAPAPKPGSGPLIISSNESKG